MIKILRGSGTERELLAIAEALRIRNEQAQNHNDYGKPILRTPFEISNADQD